MCTNEDVPKWNILDKQENVKATEAEETDSSHEMNDDDDDVVLLYFLNYNFVINVWSCYYSFHVCCFSLCQC